MHSYTCPNSSGIAIILSLQYNEFRSSTKDQIFLHPTNIGYNIFQYGECMWLPVIVVGMVSWHGEPVDVM